MIEDDLIALTSEHLLLLDKVDFVEERELAIEDPDLTAGLLLDDWVPREYEMTGQISNHATLTEYKFKIQHASLHVDEAAAGLEGRGIAKKIRLMLCGDEDFLLALAAVREQDGSYVERFSKLRVTRQRYNTAGMSTNFLFMSVTEFTITTETVG